MLIFQNIQQLNLELTIFSTMIITLIKYLSAWTSDLHRHTEKWMKALQREDSKLKYGGTSCLSEILSNGKVSIDWKSLNLQYWMFFKQRMGRHSFWKGMRIPAPGRGLVPILWFCDKLIQVQTNKTYLDWGRKHILLELKNRSYIRRYGF